MQRSYYLKWCFIMIGTTAIGAAIVRVGDTKQLYSYRFLIHILLISINIFPAWLIQAYFKQVDLPPFARNARIAISITAGILVALLLNYTCAMSIPSSLRMGPGEAPELTFIDLIKRLLTSAFLTTLCFIIFNIIYTNDTLQKKQLENEHFKQVQLRAQLLSLQQQLSPHFLFNSLSTLKTIATDPDTKRFIVQLSHVYRYLLNVKEKDVTTLEEELSFVRSYLYILQERFENALVVTIHVPEDHYNYVIPPLTLQLLIENAIKHNSFSIESPLQIKIGIPCNGILRVENSLSLRKTPEESTNLGLANIKERFQLLLRKEPEIIITTDSFVVNLPLISYESYYH